MSLLNKIPFFKHKEVPIPEQDSLGGNMGLGSQDSLSDQTGLGNVGDQADRIGLPSSQSSSPGPQFEPVQESLASQPSSFNEMHQKSLSKNDDLQALSKNVEVISSKVDTIKAILDNLSQKIEKIEKIAEGEKEEPQKGYGRW